MSCNSSWSIISFIQVVISNKRTKKHTNLNFTYFLCHYLIISNYIYHHKNLAFYSKLFRTTFNKMIIICSINRFVQLWNHLLFCYYCQTKNKNESISLFYIHKNASKSDSGMYQRIGSIPQNTLNKICILKISYARCTINIY